ncbi:MAG: peptidoglycan binding domain-containing protein [Gaiellaceae bacterium]
MKRSFVLALVVACALAGVTAAAVLADDGTPTTGTVSTDTTTTATTTTPTTTTTTTTTAVPTPPRAPRRIAVRVTVGGVPVGGLTPADAVVAVRAGFSTPLRLVYGRYRVAADPGRLGAIGLAQQAVGRARTARPGTHVKLAVSVRPGPLRSYLRRIATRIDRAPVDSTLVLRGTRPYISPDRNGTRLDVERALRTISARLRAGKRGAVSLPARVLAPAATRASFGAIVVIRRGANRLELFDGMRSVRTFGVATGQSQYPTPLGSFQIVVK